MISDITLVGSMGGACTTLAYLPQVVKAWKTRSTEDVSMGMFLVMVIGAALWLIYGALIHDAPLMVSSGVTLVLAATILVLKLHYE